MQQKSFRFGPQNWSTTNPVSILKPPVLPVAATPGIINGSDFTGNPIYQYTYIILTHIRVVNTGSGVVSISLGINPTAVNTLTKADCGFWYVSPVPTPTQGTNYLDWYGRVRLDVQEWLTAQSSTSGSDLTIMGEGEIGIF